ncbi:MAG: uncharacterized protein QOF36_1583 [Microbacteriaceae bacterium]|jgi:carbon monoxide dehydrogenase subunit G|nr:uncharacterized protein [Microbacteriaceae bacterium]MDQ1732270.1 uncharacterized protein [Pseudonocardiales bacterium]
MKVAGQALLHAPIEQVWTALNDPAVLVRAIPGCERLEETGADSYSMTVTAGVASIKGTYAGQVTLSDQQAPNSLVMKASGAGSPGTVSADVRVTLSQEDHATRISYDADAIIGGVIGGVGQRMLGGVAKKLAGEFFAQVDDVLTGRAPEVATATSLTPAPTGPPGQSPAPGIFVAPERQSRVAALRRNGDFVLGALAGAAIALLGVLVGSRRSR